MSPRPRALSPRPPKALRTTPAAQAPRAAPAAAPARPGSANVIALSADRALIELLRDSLAGFHRVWRADDVAHAGELFVTAGNAVFLVDASLAGCDPRELASRVHQQFPDLAIIVAVNRDNGALLAPLVSSGVVFQCLDVSASAETIRHMVDATQRCPRSMIDRPAAAPRKALAAAIAGFRPSIRFPKLTMPRIRVNRVQVRQWSGRCLRLVALWLTVWAVSHWEPWKYAGELFARPDPAPTAPVRIDIDLKLQKLLDDAGAALARDRLVNPPGRNALELYRAALELDPDNDRAEHGIDNVAEKLLAEAERALGSRDLPRLASAIDAARSARPDHPRLEHYSLQLKRERERMFGPGRPRAASTTVDR